MLNYYVVPEEREYRLTPSYASLARDYPSYTPSGVFYHHFYYAFVLLENPVYDPRPHLEIEGISDSVDFNFILDTGASKT